MFKVGGGILERKIEAARNGFEKIHSEDRGNLEIIQQNE